MAGFVVAGHTLSQSISGVWEDINLQKRKFHFNNKQGKTMWNWDKKVKYRLKIKKNAEILAHGYFGKRGNQLKRGTLTPMVEDW